jgi:hypothetical protein
MGGVLPAPPLFISSRGVTGLRSTRKVSIFHKKSMAIRHVIASRILLIDGVLLILLAFVHLFQTPIIGRWLSGELTAAIFTEISPVILFNHIVLGILLIPVGVSTLYIAAGVRAGQALARIVALINAVTVMILPLVAMFIAGTTDFNSLPFVLAGAAITVIGISMFIPLIWLGQDTAGPGA